MFHSILHRTKTKPLSSHKALQPIIIMFHKMIPQKPGSGRVCQSLTVLMSLYLLAAGLNSSFAQTLQLRYTFEDSGTTAASDGSGALSVPLNLLSFSGAA